MLILYSGSEGEKVLRERCRVEVRKDDTIATLHASAIVPHYGTMYVSFSYYGEMMRRLRSGETLHAFVISSEMRGSLCYTMLWGGSYAELSRMVLGHGEKILEPKVV